MPFKMGVGDQGVGSIATTRVGSGVGVALGAAAAVGAAVGAGVQADRRVIIKTRDRIRTLFFIGFPLCGRWYGNFFYYTPSPRPRAY